MDVAVLIWAVALTILVVVGIVWVLDLQARMGQHPLLPQKTASLAGCEAGKRSCFLGEKRMLAWL